MTDNPAGSNPPTSGQGAMGRRGEQMAATRLEAMGYRVVARNYRTRYGEVDLVAWDGDCLVFIEVKTRRGRSYGLPQESVTRTKQEHLILAAQSYLGEMGDTLGRPGGVSNLDWRIDVVSVQLGIGDTVRSLEVLKGVVPE